MAHHVHRDLAVTKNLRGICNAASQIIAGAQQAYRSGVFPPMVRDNLETVQHDLIRLLALHEDGAGYGHAPVDIVSHFRILEQVATDLLKATDSHEASSPN